MDVGHPRAPEDGFPGVHFTPGSCARRRAAAAGDRLAGRGRHARACRVRAVDSAKRFAERHPSPSLFGTPPERRARLLQACRTPPSASLPP